MQIDNLLDISNARGLSGVSCTNFGSLYGERHAILQSQSYVPKVTTEQCKENMAVVPDDIWNLVCLECRVFRH